MDASGGFHDPWTDFQPFINFPEENLFGVNNAVDFQLPGSDIGSNVPSNHFDMHFTPDMNFSPYGHSVNSFDTVSYPSSSTVNESPQTTISQDFCAPQPEDFRPLVESLASVDQRARSLKQKRRDAAIDLHLKRFVNSHSEPQVFGRERDSSISNTPSMTCSYTSAAEQSPPLSTSATSSPPNEHSTGSSAGGCELVFDINLNTATQLPKKQKKRTRAQIEDYINTRRNGACMKHKKQHKKCNCHEKQSMKLSVVDVKARTRPAPASRVSESDRKTVDQNVLQTLPTNFGPSSQPPVVSKLDDLLLEEGMEPEPEPWEDVLDWERWFDLEYASCNPETPQQASGNGLLHDGPPRLRHRITNEPQESTNIRASVESSRNFNAPATYIRGTRRGVRKSGSRRSGLPANMEAFAESLRATRYPSGALNELPPSQTPTFVKDSASRKTTLPRSTKASHSKATLAPLNFLGGTIFQQSRLEWSLPSRRSTASVPRSLGLSAVYVLAASAVAASRTIPFQFRKGSSAATSAVDLQNVIGAKTDAASFTVATDLPQAVSLPAQKDVHLFRDAISAACHLLTVFLGFFIASLQSISHIAVLWRSTFFQCVSQKRNFATGPERHFLLFSSEFSNGRRLLPLQL